MNLPLAWIRRPALFTAIGACVLAAACSPPPAPSPPTSASAPPPPRPAPPPIASATASPELPPRAPWAAFPTMANAGAQRCSVTAAVSLGPIVHDHPVLGFGPPGGLAAWKPDDGTLAIQRIAPEGNAIGTPATTPLEAGWTADRIYVLEKTFVVILRMWGWPKPEVRWRALIVGLDGQPRPPARDLDFPDMDIRAGQAIDGARIALILMPAAIAKNRDHMHGRWQTISLSPDGAITSQATEVDVDDLGRLSTEALEPADLGGQRGWAVLREGAMQPFGVFGGKRLPAAGATLLRPSDVIQARVYNLAEPPPRGAGGRIYEALPSPGLVRTVGDKDLGSPLDLDGQGIGPSFDIAWTGARFIYPHTTENAQRTIAVITAIDCSP